MQFIQDESNGTVESISFGDSTSTSPSAEVNTTKEHIVQAVFHVIGSTPHKRFSKPSSEVIVRLPREHEHAAVLLLGRAPKTTSSSSNDRYLQWEFSGYQVAEWLEGVAPALIHPVPFDGQSRSHSAGTAEDCTIPAWAIWEGLHATLEKTTDLLYLKFRTRLVGLGRPAPGVFGPPLDLWGMPVQLPHPHYHYQIQQYVNELQYLQWSHQQQMMQLSMNPQVHYQSYVELTDTTDCAVR